MAIENTNDFIVGRLANFTNTAEGSFLPPQQKGQFRVPFVSNLQLLQTQQGFRQTTFTLAWNDIVSNVPNSQALTVDHYNIYYNIPGDGTGQPIGPNSAKQSPAIITVPFNGQAPVTFTVQTVLTNGMTSELASSPTTTGFTNPTLLGAGDINIPQSLSGPNGTLTLNNITWTSNSPGAGQVAWSAGQVNYQGITYNIAAGNIAANFAYVYWQLASPTTFQSSAGYPTLGANDFLVALNAVNVSGSYGNYSPVFEAHNSITDRTIFSPGSIKLYSTNGVMASIGRNIGGAPSNGVNNQADIDLFYNGSTAQLPVNITCGSGQGAINLANGANPSDFSQANLGISASPAGGFLALQKGGSPTIGFEIIAGNGSQTTATAGAHGAPPAQVAGYYTVVVDGANVKIPYYNV